MAAASTTSLKLDDDIRVGSVCWRERPQQTALATWVTHQATGLHATAEEVDAWLAKLEAGEDAAAPECHG